MIRLPKAKVVYITGVNARKCNGGELIEALRVHNAVRARPGSGPLDVSLEPSQRMYCIDVAKIEIYSAVRDEEGLISSETRVAVKPDVLRESP